MLKIDNNLLLELGLGGLPDAEKNSFLKHIYETLEMRVGIRLADQMTNQQLDEFEQYFEAKDDAGAFKWLETNFPNYKDIVQEEFDKLKSEVAQSAPQILAASQASAQSQPASVTNPAGPAPVPAPTPDVQPQQPQPQPAAPTFTPPPAPEPLAPPAPASPAPGAPFTPPPTPMPPQFPVDQPIVSPPQPDQPPASQ